ncbi:MAG: type II secretory pathway, component PulD [Puniceicoccaceae bacterium]|nr:MAG: type II secretory pathway, component PulD [Puniceicoccaceae bacterium]
MNTTRATKILLLGLGIALISSIPSPVATLHADDTTDLKIRLMSDALQARDAGDLVTARANLERLVELAPDDASVRRLLEAVRAEQARREADRPAPQQPAPQPAPQPQPTPAPPPAPAPSTPSPNAGLMAEAESLVAIEVDRIEANMAAAREMQEMARRQVRQRNYRAAIGTIDQALALLEPNRLTQSLISELNRERAQAAVSLAREEPMDPAEAQAMAAREANLLPLQETSPNYLALQARVNELLLKGRSQYVGGDITGAEETFKQVEAMDPDNVQAKAFLIRIARERGSMAFLNREKTREQMLEEVNRAWQRPGIYADREIDEVDDGLEDIRRKLDEIIIPTINFSGLELNRVINTLSAISEEFDPTGIEPRGVNIVLVGRPRADQPISLSVRNMSLRRIIEYVVDQAGYEYILQPDAVEIRSIEDSLITEVLPVTQATVRRLTALGVGPAAAAAPAQDDPFAAPAQDTPASAGAQSDAIRNFLSQAGVNFNIPGTRMVYDGSAIIVTQTPREIQRIRNILLRYSEIRQVEIEAKFMDVSEGALEELGFNWNLRGGGRPAFDPTTGLPLIDSSGNPILNYRQNFQSANRNLAQAFTGGQTGTSAITIVDQTGTFTFPFGAPNIPGTVVLGSGAPDFATISGVISGFDVGVVIRALSQRAGTDLLSAPKVTVLSGNQASIRVAQELRYPDQYGDIQSEVGTAGVGQAAGSAGVTITAGTPQDFQTRNVGVELDVTPTVEEDDYTISLDLNPRVTEFEGFVEYGGPSVALTGTGSVTVPSGFFQPIFSVREVSTRVSIWDGATVVMGGLTREEIRLTSDKVPVLGDIPLLGRFFRSKGEGSQKRNLLIFVTANLVSPGGSPKNQQLSGVPPSSVFQNPTIVTPGGAESRTNR